MVRVKTKEEQLEEQLEAKKRMEETIRRIRNPWTGEEIENEEDEPCCYCCCCMGSNTCGDCGCLHCDYCMGRIPFDEEE